MLIAIQNENIMKRRINQFLFEQTNNCIVYEYVVYGVYKPINTPYVECMEFSLAEIKQ